MSGGIHTHQYFNSTKSLTADEINIFRDKLQAHYQSEQYTDIQLLGDDEQLRIHLKNIFVNLNIIEQKEQREREQENLPAREKHTAKNEDRSQKTFSNDENINKLKEFINLEDLFKANQLPRHEQLGTRGKNSFVNAASCGKFDPKKLKRSVKEGKKILLLGESGTGKSILCRYLAYRWSNLSDEDKLLTEFAWVFHIELKRLALDFPKDQSANKTVWHVLHCYYWKKHSLSEQDAQSLWDELQVQAQDQDKKILFLFDGYDEIAHLQHPLVEEILLSQPYYLLTSRPYAIQTKRKDVDEILENIGLLPQNILEYIDKYFTHRHPNKKAREQLNDWLNKQVAVRSMCAIPIYLELLCNVWITDKERIQKIQGQIQMADLYNLLVERLLKRMLGKMNPQNLKGYEEMDKEALYQQPDVIIARSYLAKLAFEGLTHNEGRLLIPGQLLVDIRAFIQNQLTDLVGERSQQLITPDKFNWRQCKKAWKQRAELSNLHKYLLKAGFLKNIGDSEDISKNSYFFLHSSFQEYFAALYVTHDFEAHRDFIIRCKHNYNYDEVWSFVSGLLTKDILMLKKFLDLLIEEPRDIFGQHHLLLLIKCLVACASCASSLSNVAAINLVMNKLKKVFDTFLPAASFGRSHFLHFHLIKNPDFFHYQQVQEYFLEKIEKNEMVRLSPSISLGEQSKKCFLSYLAEIYDSLPRPLQNTIDRGFFDEDPWVGYSILLSFPQKNTCPESVKSWFLKCLKKDGCELATLPRLAQFLQADNNFKETIIELIAKEKLSLHAIKRILWSLQELNNEILLKIIWGQFKKILTEGSCKHRLMNLKISSPASLWMDAAVIISMLKFKSDGIINLLFEGLKHQDDTVKYMCIDAIFSLNGFNSESVSVLKIFLLAKNEMLIMKALTSLLKFNIKPPEMQNWLMSIFLKKEEDISATASIGYLRSEALLALVEYKTELTENDFEKLLQFNFIFIKDTIYTTPILESLITLLKALNIESNAKAENILSFLVIIHEKKLESKYSPYDINSIASNLILFYISIAPKDMIYLWHLFWFIEICKEKNSILLSSVALLELDKYFNNKYFIQYIHDKILHKSDDCALAIQALNTFEEKPNTFINDLIDNFERFSPNSQIEASIILINNKFYEPRFIKVLINGIEQAEDNFLIILNSLKQVLKEGLSTKILLSKTLAAINDHGNVNLEIIKEELVKIMPLFLLNEKAIKELFILAMAVRKNFSFRVSVIGVLVDLFKFFYERKCDIECSMISELLKIAIEHKDTPISSFAALALIEMGYKEPEIINELLNIFKFSQEYGLLEEAFNCLRCLDLSIYLNKIMLVFPELIRFIKLKSMHVLDEINNMLAKTPLPNILEQYVRDKKTVWLFLIANELKKRHHALYVDNDKIYFSFYDDINESNINYSAPIDKQQLEIFEDSLFDYEENILRKFHLSLGLQYDNFLEEKKRDGLSKFLITVAGHSGMNINDLIRWEELPTENLTTLPSSTFDFSEQKSFSEGIIDERRKFAKDNEFLFKDIKGDDNCFFSAIAFFLNKFLTNSVLTHVDIRREAVDYLRDNSNLHIDFDEGGELGTLNAYLSAMGKEDVWANGPILDATALRFNIRLDIIDFRDNDELHVIHINEGAVNAPLFTLMRTGEEIECQHYDVLIPNQILENKLVVNTIFQGIKKKDDREKLFKSLKDKQARIQLFLESVKLSEYVLVYTLGKGDCFFDACAQVLTSLSKVQVNGLPYDIKSLRQLCHDYSVELDERMNDGKISKKNNWIYQEINSADNYNNYLATIHFTANEAAQNENHWVTKGIATWGRLSVDGRIISEKLGVSIHWVEILDKDSAKQVGVPLRYPLISTHEAHSISSSQKVSDARFDSLQLLDYNADFSEAIVPGDGNCLFYAIAHQLKMIGYASNYSHLDLRQLAVNHIRNHMPDYNAFIEGDILHYLDDMAKEGIWGGEHELRALADTLTIRINVFMSGKVQPSYGNKSNPAIHLSYNGNTHYNSLTPKIVQQQGVHGIQGSDFSSKEKIPSLQTVKENEGIPEGVPILHQLQRPKSKTSSLEHQFEINYQDKTLIHLVVYKNHVVPLLKFPVFSEQQTHTYVSQSKHLSLGKTNMTHSYQLLRSMSRDSLTTAKTMPDSKRLKRRASMS